MRELLNVVAGLFEEDNAGWMNSNAFTYAIEQLRQARHGAALSAPDINVDLLHQSPKYKSGFVGVYVVRGNFWRATSRTVLRRMHTAVNIGDKFRSSIEAAWARRQHYIKHSFPYGELEFAIEREIHTYPDHITWSDRRIITDIEEDFKWKEGRERLFGPSSATWVPDLPPDGDGYTEEEGKAFDELAAQARGRTVARIATEAEPKMLGFENGLPPELEASLEAAVKETAKQTRGR